MATFAIENQRRKILKKIEERCRNTKKTLANKTTYYKVVPVNNIIKELPMLNEEFENMVGFEIEYDLYKN